MSYPQNPYSHPTMQQPPPPRKRRVWPWIVGGFVAILVVGSTLSSGGSKTTASTAAPSGGATTAAAPSYSYTGTQPAADIPAVPAGPATTASDGTYQVGTDIAAGRYKTPGPDKSSIFPYCYWERASNDSGDLRSIKANDNIGGPGTVTIQKGEFAKFTGGCTWTKQ